ncbi:MAG: hypothetical protein WCP24_03315, partial [bacterium]
MVIIESPFVTERRMRVLLPIFKKLRAKNIKVIINTKPFDEHDPVFKEQAIWAVGVMQDMGIDVLFTSGHHRKLAIIDDILWEGSLNILSQNDSCEIMHRMTSKELVADILKFTGLKEWCK